MVLTSIKLKSFSLIHSITWLLCSTWSRRNQPLMVFASLYLGRLTRRDFSRSPSMIEVFRGSCQKFPLKRSKISFRRS